MMQRRQLIAGGAATLLLPPLPTNVMAAPQQQLVVRQNGVWNGKIFEYRHAGGDPFGNAARKQDLAIALPLLGIPEQYRPTILTRIQTSVGVYTTPDSVEKIRQGDRYDAMVSGGIVTRHAWVTQNVVAYPGPSWATDEIHVWRFTFGRTRLIFGMPQACLNPIVIVVDAPVEFSMTCRCEPAKGDLCSRKK